MSNQGEPQFPTLQDDVWTALKQWHNEATGQSPIHYLYFFRQILRERQQHGLNSSRGATNQLLRSAIQKLELSNSQDAEFLQYRFLDKWQIHRLANHYNIADSTVYSMQTETIERLSSTIRQMEFEASAAQKNLLVTRLEPSSYVNLVGIEHLVTQLEETLTSTEAPWVISLEGIGGIGKTSLADHVLRRLIQQSQVDEIGWVTARQVRFNLGGALQAIAEPALTASSLIEKLIMQLMPEWVQSANQPAEALLAALKERLKSIPHLIVIDNLETLVDVEDLLPTLQTLCNPTKFILTSRESLRIEPNIYHLKLSELSREDALALIRQEARLSNLPLLADCSDEELTPMVKAVGGNPLALRLVIGQTHIHSLESIVQDLENASGQPVGNLYSYIYRRSWEALDEKTRLVFLTMPLAKPEGESLDFLAKICAMEPGEVRNVLNKLVLYNLVDARGDMHSRRYSIHSLTRTFLQNDIIGW